jgi:hypothetical protein
MKNDVSRVFLRMGDDAAQLHARLDELARQVDRYALFFTAPTPEHLREWAARLADHAKTASDLVLQIAVATKLKRKTVTAPSRAPASQLH